MASNDEPDLVAYTPEDALRIGRMLRAYESGALTQVPTNDAGGGGIQTETINAKISQLAPGGGKYWLTLIRPPKTDLAPTGDLQITDLGDTYTPPNADLGKILGLYLPEVSTSAHALAVNTPVVCRVLRRQPKGMLAVEILGGGAIPTGQYQGMYLLMVTDNRAGYAYPFSHKMENV